MTHTIAPATRRSLIRTLLLAVAFTAVVIVLLLWLAGAFERKIDARAADARRTRLLANAQTEPARMLTVPATEPAVGTIRAVYQTSVAAKLLAKVSAIHVQAGQTVKDQEVLVRLDDADLQARLRQAEAAVAAAEASRAQAQIEFERVERLFQQGNETRLERERAGTLLQTAEARLEEARQARAEAETILSYATIRSPMDGRVVDKLVEVGDMVNPGQPLLTLYDPARMQLVASVRESLTQRLAVGQDIGVHIDALNKTCLGRISEIVPEAEAATRSFAVKVTGPCPEGIYSGMFGRLLIPLDEQQVLVIPRGAVRRVGQLDLVDVAAETPEQPATLQRRAVQLGREFGADVEVLAGLRAGERVVVPPA